MLKEYVTGDALPVIQKDIDQKRIDGWAALSGDFNGCTWTRFTPGDPFQGHHRPRPHVPGLSQRADDGLLWRGLGPGRPAARGALSGPHPAGDTIGISGQVEDTILENGCKILQCRLGISKQGLDKPAVTGLAEVILAEEAS